MSFAAIWAPGVKSRLPDELEHFRAALAEQVEHSRGTTKGWSREHAAMEVEAADWLLAGLFEGVCSFPKLPLALPRDRNAYASSSPLYVGYPYGAVSRLLDAATALGFVLVEEGGFLPEGRSIVTRVHAHGALLDEMKRIGCVWQPLPPPRWQAQIQIGHGGKGTKHRHLNAAELQQPQIRQWLDDLMVVNEMLGEACIFLDLPDDTLEKIGAQALEKSSAKGKASIPSSINYARRHLTRIFSRDRFDHGGRLYRGWWQEVPSSYRPYLTIGDHLTVEVDFSGIALRCMYAKRGIDMPSDPYDIGLNFKGKNDPRRKLVKKFLNAIINDETGKYRLKRDELKDLGLSHRKLNQLIKERHRPISDLFATGEGLRMQFVDAEIAMGILTRFAKEGEVCLPVHDSFIVRAGLKDKLQEVMREEFRRVTGVDCPMTVDDSEIDQRMYNLKPPQVHGLGPDLIIDYLNFHFQKHTTAQAMLSSWYVYMRSLGREPLSREYSFSELRELEADRLTSSPPS